MENRVEGMEVAEAGTSSANLPGLFWEVGNRVMGVAVGMEGALTVALVRSLGLFWRAASRATGPAVGMEAILVVAVLLVNS